MATRSSLTTLRGASRQVGQVGRAATRGYTTATSFSTRQVVSRQSARSMGTYAGKMSGKAGTFSKAALVVGVFGVGVAASTQYAFAKEGDYEAVKEAIRNILDDEKWDDGSWGPVLVRLAWHASGTYSQFDKTGGSDGATMRYNPEAGHGANAGLEYARSKLESVKKQFPWISYADLWVLAAYVAIEEMGGPKMRFRPGRKDDATPAARKPTPDGRLPDAARGADHIRAIFYRMGFSDQEIVALAGAHALGRCHTDRSGYDGPWTNSPTTFSNEFYTQLMNNKWVVRKWAGPKQYQSEDGNLMMLPADMALKEDDDFRYWVEIYANDEERFFKDFAMVFVKLTELGVPAFEEKKSGWLW